MCIDIDENKKAIYIDRLKQYIHKLDIKKYDVYKLNPKIFVKFGGADYKVSHLDIILSGDQEESYLEEELINLEIEETKWHNLCVEMEEGNCLEYEEDDGDENIDISDLDTYNKIRFIYNENQRLENIVKVEFKNFSGTKNHREHKKVIMKLVRANSNYKDLKNKKQLSSCVTKVLNKTDMVYTFDLTQRLCEILFECHHKDFDLAYDLLLDLRGDIDDTINNLNEICLRRGLEFVNNISYIDKLEEVKSVLEEMIEFENFRKDGSLKYKLLEYVGLKTENKINSKYSNIKTIPRNYKSDYRTSSKESIRNKVLELKNEGVRNNEIARRLGKSKGYISELINGKK